MFAYPKAILIVEDEPLIAMMLEDFIEAMGMTPAGAADNVADALKCVGRGGIDAVILDVNLRGGEKSFPIADALIAANIPFVFASGGSGDSIPDTYRDRPVLMKPFAMEGVGTALAGLVAE